MVAVPLCGKLLPSRDPRLPWFTDGRALSLREVPRREQMPPILPE